VRIGNCRLGNASASEKRLAHGLLDQLSGLLRDCNPYVQDFVSLKEMESVPEGRIVINAEACPAGAHVRTYNKPEGLKEVCVIIDHNDGRATGRVAVIQPR
jgi:hypothetical protein